MTYNLDPLYRFVFSVISLALCLAINCSVSSAQESENNSSQKSERTFRGYPYGTSAESEYTPIFELANDTTYGYVESNAVLVGPGWKEGNGSENSQLFLNALRGPNNEIIEYERAGSCCSFATSSSELGSGLLDKYVVTYPGCKKQLILFVNIYDPGEPKVPVGFTPRKD